MSLTENAHDPEYGPIMSSPGAGPSRLPTSPRAALHATHHADEDEEEKDRLEFLQRRKDYVELERSIESSNELLSSLATYLSNFQNDLSAVSGQISDLQGRSADIEAQLKGRKTVLPPLTALVSDIVLPPALVLTIRDTQPAQNPDMWLTAIAQLEEKINAHALQRGEPTTTTTSKSTSASSSGSGKTKAAGELEGILDALRNKALTRLPPFLLSLIRPLKSSSTGLSTNLAVLQTSLLLKYQPFYGFLLRQSPKLAKQVERGYVNAARAFYETGMRRYARTLGQIRGRTSEKADLIGVVSTDAAASSPAGAQQAYERLQYAELDLEGEAGSVVLGYMADDPDFRVPVEALFRSLMLVLVDNASAEFTFIVRFFARPHTSPSGRRPTVAAVDDVNAINNVTPGDSPAASHLDAASEAGYSRAPTPRTRRGVTAMDDQLKDAERIWTEVFGSALEYVASFFSSITTATTTPPPAVPLLTLIRLNDRLLALCDARGTIPLVPVLLNQKMSLWPIFRKEMDAHIDSLRKLADEAEGKGLAGFMGKGVKDGAVRTVASRYAALFSCVTALSEEAEEAMIFSSMSRLRAELVRLAQTQANKIKSVPERHSFLSSIYEIIMHELVSGPGPTTHPRLQSELSFFRTREEEARRRIAG